MGRYSGGIIVHVFTPMAWGEDLKMLQECMVQCFSM